MSEQFDYSIEDILSTEELETLGRPEEVHHMPDAQVVEWEEDKAVTAPGFSIASSMDRFKAGSLNFHHRQALEGFYSEFVENGERVIFADEELRDIVGERAVARVEGFEDAYAVQVRPPEDALEVVRRYDSEYTGDVEEEFWTRIDANNAVIPVTYDLDGVVDETGISLMAGEGVMASEDIHSLDSEEDVEAKRIDEDLRINRYEAPEDSDASYHVEVLLPPGFDDISHEIINKGIVIDVDGERELESLPRDMNILDYGENNGIYTVELS